MNPTKKKWLLILAALLAGMLASGGVGFFIILRLVKVISWQEDLASQTEAATVLLCLKYIDRGTTNSLSHFQHYGRSVLSNYVHEVEQLKKEGHVWALDIPHTYQDARQYLHPFSFADKKEEAFFYEKMIPLAQEFIQRNGLPYDSKLGTNSITRYLVDFYKNRPGGQANLKLDNDWWFYFFSDGQNTEVRRFHDKTKTSYNLSDAPKEKIEAVKALNLRNKLNDQTALELATKYFKLQGHKADDFHPVEFRQMSWADKGDPDYVPLPFYHAEWYRKDVKKEDRDAGIVALPSVMIEVSGINSNLIYYSKTFMPVGSDF